MFSAHTIHVLHVAVRDFFIFVSLLLVALFFWLIHGITVEKLTFGNYEVDGLYIKLDKKLILNVEHVTIPKSKARPSFDNVDRTFDHIKNLLTYFESIYLEKINFQNNHFTIFYADGVLYMTSDDYEIAGTVERHGRELVADVSMLHLKAYETVLSGRLSYDFNSAVLETKGLFSGYGISGEFNAEKRGDTVTFGCSTGVFADPAPLVERLKLPQEIAVWITRKVKAKKYRLSSLRGKLILQNGRAEIDLDSLRGDVRFEDVQIAYKEGIIPVHAAAMELQYRKGALYFTLEKPRHKQRKLDGSSVVITHVAGGGDPVLILDLHITGPVDREVRKILEAYRLKIPVSHTGGMDQLNVLLHIPLGETEKKLRLTLDAQLQKGMLKIGTFPLAIRSGRVRYSDGKVVLKQIVADDRIYRGTVSGTVDIKKKEAALLLDTVRFSLGKRESPFLTIEKQKIAMKLSYAHALQIELPVLKTKIVKKEKAWIFALADLSKIVPYIKENPLDIKRGSLTLGTDDMRRFSFRGKVDNTVCFLYEKNDRCYTSIPVEGNIDTQTGRFELYAFGKRLYANIPKGQIRLHRLNIDLKVLLEEQRKRQKTAKKRLLEHKYIIIGKQSQLRYSPYRLVLDSYDIELFPNGNIKAIGSLDGDIVKFNKKGKQFFLQALRIKDTMLHPLINFKGLKRGRYSLKKEGDLDTLMKGHIIIEGGVLSDFKAYSNTLAFINTVPALATLNRPGFSGKGFKIEEGVIKYTMTPKKIVFESVYLKGNSATVVGKGEIDLQAGTLNINLAIQSVREFGKVVGKIPLLGYILMGDDNSMTVGLKVTGTLDNPKVNTSVAKDILTLPLQLLKRTITAPAHLDTTRRTAPDIPDFNQIERDRQKHTLPKKESAAEELF